MAEIQLPATLRAGTNRSFPTVVRCAGAVVVMALALTFAGCRNTPKPTAITSTPAITVPAVATAPAFERLPPVAEPPAQPIQLVNATVASSASTVLPSADRFEVAQVIPPPQLAEPVKLPAPASLSLFDALETSLLQNPDLTALRQNEGVGLGMLGVARTYPFNPYVQVQATPLQSNPVGGPGTIYHYVLVMETIQIAHQQRHREEAGMANLNTVRWNILQAELNNVAMTERLYFTALYQRGLRNLARANAELNEQLLTVSEKQLEAGQTAAADVAIVRLDTRSTRRQAQLAEATYQTAMLDLRRQLNLPLDVPLDATGSLSDYQWLAATSQRLAEAKSACSQPCTPGGFDPLADIVAGRPDVMAARSDLAMARANANLARASRVPDLQIGPYYQRTEAGTTYWGFRAQSDIPVVNSGVPLARQRAAEARQRQVVWEQLFARARVEAQAAVDRYERARRLLESAPAEDPNALPADLAKLEEQFKSNEVDIVRIFTARSSLLQAQRTHLDLLNELAQAAATVTAATGTPPDTLLQMKTELKLEAPAP